MKSIAWRSLVLVFVLFVTSCGSGNGRQTFEGEVKYKGEPLPFGTVIFEPDESKGNAGMQGVGEIRNGRYKTTPDFGPQAGPYVARITGYARPPSIDEQALFIDYRIPVVIGSDTRTLDLDVPDQSKTSKSGK
jgi:hypothetical protein